MYYDLEGNVVGDTQSMQLDAQFGLQLTDEEYQTQCQAIDNLLIEE